jgi:DNA helicase HerA-like ATPase
MTVAATTTMSSSGPSASSTDGRTFVVRGLQGPQVPGDLVVLRIADGGHVVGQLLDVHVDDGVTAGAGTILGVIGDGSLNLSTAMPFVDASLEPASPETLAVLEAARQADMEVGTSRSGPALLASSAFNRHTFLCGQSGSGKSYAMGVLLEQLLIDTDLSILILDPNGDFVGLGETLGTADPADRERLAAGEVRVFRRTPGVGERPLRARFTAMSIEAKAAVLQLDPLADRMEYNVLLGLAETMRTHPPEIVVRELLASTDADERFLARRLENLGVMGWDVWAGLDLSLLEQLEERPRTAVIDLGGFDHPREPLVVALELLDHLWARREQREPVLLVIDEAHNVCPSTPTDPLAEATTARIVQLANEGRKYGIWMLLCSQRPSRIHESVLSQCDNLALMRMNSPGDLAHLERVFGFAPAEMLRSATGFHQGECLMAGGFAPAPAFVRIRQRRTREGGGDVRVPRRADSTT